MEGNNHHPDDLMSGDEGFQKAKEKIYFMTLETHFFAKLLSKYKSNYNKIDKNLATMLYQAVDTISEFLNEAEIQEDDDKHDVRELIPSIESEVCQGHRYFYCKCCNMSVKASPKSFNEHFFGNKHIKKLRELEQSMPNEPKERMKKQRKTEADADTVKGSTQSLNSIKSEVANHKKVKKERLNSLPANGPKNAPAEIGIPKKFKDFLSTADLDNYAVILLSEGLQIMRSKAPLRVCDNLRHRLELRYPGVHVYPFGSMVIGLGKKNADLDIFVDIGNCYSEKPSKRKMKDAIHNTQRILGNFGDQWTDFEPVTKARTPILKVLCRAERIDCDLSFSNGLSHRNTSLISYFIELQPVCKKLTVFVKFWASQLQIGVNSYLISLMVIFYLQQKNVLPSVQQIQNCVEPQFIDGWNANFKALSLAQLKIPLATDFRNYLIGFFSFYAYDFNFQQHIISVLTGSPVDKGIFDHGNESNLPPEFERYKNYMASINLEEADEVEDLFANYKPFVIQDPFELCHNVAKGVALSKVQKIAIYMQQSHKILSERKTF